MLDMKWYLLLLICIFLITRKIKNLFIFYWLLVFISCNLKTHIVFAHFLLGYLLLINIKTKQSLILCHLYRWKIPSDAFNLFFYLSCQFHFKCHFKKNIPCFFIKKFPIIQLLSVLYGINLVQIFRIDFFI